MTVNNYDIHALEEGKNYIANGKKIFTFECSNKKHSTVQGGYFNGTNFYVCMVYKDETGHEFTKICVFDENGNTVRESDTLNVDHANNITYNAKKNVFVISHCQSPEGYYYRYSYVDADTLTVVKTADKEYPFFSMAYCEKLDKYASGEWAGQTLDVWDGEINNEMHVDVKMPGSLSQGVFCDEKAIYFVRSSQNGYSSEIRIYDWQLNLVRTVPLTLSDEIEPESINIVNGKTYVMGNDFENGCGVAYILEYEEEK